MPSIIQAMIKNGIAGRPGMKANKPKTPAAMKKIRELEMIWVTTSYPKLESEAALVTIIPVAVEIKRAGI